MKVWTRNTAAFLKSIAIALIAIGGAGLLVYAAFNMSPGSPVEGLIAGDRLFAGGAYRRALVEYDKALALDPEAPYLLRAKARALMQLGRDNEALAWLDRAAELQPSFAATYLARAMLHDNMERYALAVEDYERALELDEEIGRGTHWLVRYLRHPPETPQTVRQRLRFLRRQLAGSEDGSATRREATGARGVDAE